MLSKSEERFVKSPSSFLPRKRAYAKKQLEKKITKTASDIGLLIVNGYDLSEIIGSMLQHSENKVKRIMEQIIQVQKILEDIGTTTLPITESEESKTDDKDNDTSKKSSWDL